MSDENHEEFLARSLRQTQENLRQAGPAAMVGYMLLGAIIMLGGIGYAVDAWRGTSPWFLLTGLLLGVVVGFVELAKVIWCKGTSENLGDKASPK